MVGGGGGTDEDVEDVVGLELVLEFVLLLEDHVVGLMLVLVEETSDVVFEAIEDELLMGTRVGSPYQVVVYVVQPQAVLVAFVALLTTDPVGLKTGKGETHFAVSYTHLTLPTKRIV